MERRPQRYWCGYADQPCRRDDGCYPDCNRAYEDAFRATDYVPSPEGEQITVFDFPFSTPTYRRK